MMQTFDSDGVTIAYRDWAPAEGRGDPILLIHGFASNHKVNWIEPSWTTALAKAGRRVIALDNRGHGESEKLYDPEVYHAPDMAEDARRLLDHLDLERADVMGYSMGARISAFLSINHPDRVRSAVFGGLGEAMIKGIGEHEPIAMALEAPDHEDIDDPTSRAFRLFAQRTGSDLKALAACMRASRQRISTEEVGTIPCPVLVVVGSKDPISGGAGYLADRIPGGEALTLDRKDHMTAVGAREFKTAVASFLDARP